MAINNIEVLQNIGLSQKAARVYLAALELGETTIQEIARHAKLKRTTLYYTLEELRKFGALEETRQRKKMYIIASPPADLLSRAREHVHALGAHIEMLEEKRKEAGKRPRTYFLYGTPGFKQAWEMIWKSDEKEYRIITDGKTFLDFVSEQYLVEHIAAKKKILRVQSRQIIADSLYARKIIAKDTRENRTSKVMPPGYQLPCTEIICGRLVIFISPKFEKTLFVVENDDFAHTRRSLFDVLWNALPSKNSTV